MSPTQLERFESELELDFAYALGDQARFRVNVYQQRESWGAAFRLIPTEIKTFDDLGLPESLASFADLPRGLVLVTGPTGSGKSTTLAALIDRANETRADHIMTIEDPIEFVHTSKTALVNQREVGTDTHSFGAALKHVLRQDPDIILLGELRDLESISVALTAAETGHLVFATLHTSDAAQSIDRIVDVFSADQQQQVRMQLSMVLQGVVCQTLVPRADGQGRAVAVEILRVTPAIGNLIRTGKTSQLTTAMQTGSALGMQTMDQHLVTLVHDGVISLEAAETKAQDINTLRQMVGNGTPGPARPTQHRVLRRDGRLPMSTTAGKTFTYRARHRSGKVVKGALNVQSEALAVAKLTGMGLTPVNVQEKGAGTGLQKEISFGGGSVGLKPLAIATRQLATITQAGVPLLRALTVVGAADRAPEAEAALRRGRPRRRAGQVALGRPRRAQGLPAPHGEHGARRRGRRLPGHLARVDRRLLREGGEAPRDHQVRDDLPDGGARHRRHRRHRHAPVHRAGVQEDVREPRQPAAAADPGPRHAQQPDGVAAADSSRSSRSAITLWWRANKDKDSVRRIAHPLMLKIPVFGPLMGKVAIARFTRNLANMTAAGVPLLRALTIVGQSSGNWSLEQVAGRLAEAVRTGSSLAGPLAEEKMFPGMVVQMVSVGEESGSIDTMLARVADFYDDEIDATADALTSLIEPMLITVLGVVIGGMVVALYMPIFSLSSALQHAK